MDLSYLLQCSIMPTRTFNQRTLNFSMTRNSYIFLDFDGVAHPWGEVEDFRCLPLIEAVVRAHDEARIVIAADWRMLFSMPELVRHFAEDIRPRIVGTTPHLVPRRGSDLHGLREREAMAWLAQHEPDPSQVAWCAIDDAPGNWLTRSRLVLTDFKRGFTEEDAVHLERLLESFADGAHLDAPRPPSSLLDWG